MNMQRHGISIKLFLLVFASLLSTLLGMKGLSLESFTVKDGRGEDFPLSQFKKVPVRRHTHGMIAACCECDFPFHVYEFPNVMFTFIAGRRKLFLLRFCLLPARVVD